ncbi:hypothetical protein FCV25MIE_28678, partial [Fagus crenata]
MALLRGEFLMDSFALGVSGDIMDLVLLIMKFVDEELEGIGLAAAELAKHTIEQLDFAAEHSDLFSLEELGPQSVEELGDKRANSEVVMVDEVVPTCLCRVLMEEFLTLRPLMQLNQSHLRILLRSPQV